MNRLHPTGLPRRAALLYVLVAMAGALAVEAAVTRPFDSVADLSALAARNLRPLGAITAVGIVALVFTSLIHHVAATVAARAAAGVPVPAHELFAATYSAAAANRITPAGVGGAAVLARIFVRRGRLDPPAATAAVSALAVIGAIADILAFAVLVAIGALLGIHSMAREAPRLLAGLVALVPLTGAALALSGAAVVAAIVVVLHRRRPDSGARITTTVRRYRAQLTALATSPPRLIVLAAGSSGTTLALAAGFATTACLAPANLPTAQFGSLMIGYMVAAAAANALPTPGGIGTADAALVGVLAVHHVSAGPALASVLAFRLVTFWAPALVGLFTSRALHRRGAL